MNQISEMSSTVSTVVFAFVAVLAAAVAIDLWAQRLSGNRCRRVVNQNPESYLKPSKRI